MKFKKTWFPFRPVAHLAGLVLLGACSSARAADADTAAAVKLINETRAAQKLPAIDQDHTKIIENLVSTLKGNSNEWALSHGVNATNVWPSLRVLSLFHPKLNVGAGNKIISIKGTGAGVPLVGNAPNGFTWGGNLNGENQYIEFKLAEEPATADWALGYAGSRAELGAAPYAGYVGINLEQPNYLRVSTESDRWQSVQFYVLGENPDPLRAKVKDGDIKFDFFTLHSTGNQVTARNDASTSYSTLANRSIRPTDVSIGRVNYSGTHSYSTTAPRWFFLLSGKVDEPQLDNIAKALDAAARDAELLSRYSRNYDVATNRLTLKHNSISWTVEGNPPSGQFINGEWWVQGPVKLLKITPEASTKDGFDINGSMINPSENNKQGLDGRSRAGDAYVDSLNVAKTLPKTIQPGSSLLSAASAESVVTTKQSLADAAVLTVLAAPAPEGSFRPPYFGSYKPLFNKSSLRYGVFRKLKPTASAARPWTMTRDKIKEVRVDLLGIGGAQKSTELAHPNGHNYGRELSSKQTRAVLLLNLDFPDAEKAELLIEIVQRGLDTYGGIVAGFNWDADGGHRHGRKLAMYIAGKALGADEILEKVSTEYYKGKIAKQTIPGWPIEVADYDAFQEGQQHFYITENDVAASQAKNYAIPYTKEMIGLPEWKAQAFASARSKGWSADWYETGYRWINGNSNTSVVLILTLMGDRKLWGHEAMFDYIIKRYYPSEKDSTDQRMSPLTREMWEAYFPNSIRQPVNLRVVK